MDVSLDQENLDQEFMMGTHQRRQWVAKGPLVAKSMRLFRSFLLFSIGLGTATDAFAQLAVDAPSRLAVWADEAKANLSSERFPEREPAIENFRTQASQTTQYFQRATSPENAAGWLRYLNLDELIEAIEAGERDAELGRMAVSLNERLTGLTPGLELPALLRLRASVQELIRGVRYSDDERALEQLSRQLEAISKRLADVEPVPTPDDMAAVSALVNTLRDANQATATIANVQSMFAIPNIRFSLSESLVQQTVNRPVNQTNPVHDCILGTRLVGVSSLDGTVHADLQPSFGAALVHLTLNGNFASNNRGYNGPVQLRTTGVGQVFASRALLLNENGVTTQPAYVRASLSSTIQSIQHPLRIVRKIARKKAAQQKPLADQIAANKLRNRVGQQFVAQTDQTQNLRPADPLARLRPWFGRLDLSEPTRHWSSSDINLFIESMLRRPDQIASPTVAPSLTQSYDVALQVHESAIDNALTPLLAGRTVKEGQLDALRLMSPGLVNSGATAQTDAMVTLVEFAEEALDPEPPFVIDFARTRPIIFEARDGKLKIGVRGTRFAQGSRVLTRPLEITATYSPARTETGDWLLVREGDVRVDFPGRGRLTISQTALRGTIEKSFDEVFPDVLADQPFVVPSDAPVEAVRGRNFKPAVITAERGWLSMGFL